MMTPEWPECITVVVITTAQLQISAGINPQDVLEICDGKKLAMGMAGNKV